MRISNPVTNGSDGRPSCPDLFNSPKAAGQEVPEPGNENTNNFTLLRLVLAILVVFGHFRLLSGALTSNAPYNFADAAVDAFFVVSGFLIAGSFDRSHGLLAFYTRRIFRLFPLYIFVVLVQTMFIVSWLPRGPFSALKETFRYLLFNLTFANFVQHDVASLLQSRLLVPTLNPSLWTLKIEIGFYLIAPAVFMAVRRWGIVVLVSIFAGSAAYEALTLTLGLDQYARQLPGQMQFFVVGMGIYFCARNVSVSPVVAWSISVGFFLIWTFFWPLPAGIRPLIVGAFVFCFALHLPIVPLRFDLSYSVYLQHGPMIQVLLFLGLYRDRLWMLLFVLTAVLGLSFVTEQFVEKPGIRVGKRMAQKLERRPKRQLEERAVGVALSRIAEATPPSGQA